ncbi:ABC transporter ATP-binding protein [Corynebacterium sp.]|uniref:ABC transporter ATP-binding protein n=1 Tax=Corynebacterium sp. TaxID=1720 RepID=UPI0028A8F5CD|nr:ABC transporter ATP-binding protein [Corynebacterium sp.]
MSNQHLLGVADSSQVSAYLWQMLRGRRLALLGVLLLFLAESATALVVPLLIGRIIDLLNTNSSDGVPESFPQMIALLIGAAFAAGLFAWLGGVGIARITETVIADIREDYVGAALRLPRSTVETAGTGDVVTRASDDIAQVSGTLPDVLPRFFVSIFTVVLIAGTITSIDRRFLLIFLALTPLYVVHVRWYLHTGPPVYRKQRAVESVRGQHILGTLDNLDTVSAHQLAAHQLDQVSVSSWDKVRWVMRTRIVQNWLFGRLNIAQAIGIFAVLGLGVWLAFRGEVTPGAVTAAALLYQRIIGPVNGLMYVMDDFQEALSSLSRLVGAVEVRHKSEGHHNSDTSPDDNQNRPLVKIQDLDFAYPNGFQALKGIDVDIAPGETIAVVGATGAGKSTLASLVAGVYPPSGCLLERSIAADEVYSLSQETHVFIGTVRATWNRPKHSTWRLLV